MEFRRKKFQKLIDEGVDIQSNEDFNPAKSLSEKSAFEANGVRLKRWFEKTHRYLNKIQLLDEAAMFWRAAHGPNSGVRMFLSSAKEIDASFKSKTRIQVDLSRLVQVLINSETKVEISTITLDTNSVIKFADKKDDDGLDTITAIVNAHYSNKISAAITMNVSADLINDIDELRRKRTRNIANSFPLIDVSYTNRALENDKGDDERDYIECDEYKKIKQKIKNILFPNLSPNDTRLANKENDITHLADHIWAERDYFITEDNDFVRKKSKLAKELDIFVLTPEEFCGEILPLLR